MVITEKMFRALFLKLFADGIFLRGFIVTDWKVKFDSILF